MAFKSPIPMSSSSSSLPSSLQKIEWYNYGEISKIGTETKRHFFSDTKITVEFKCHCNTSHCLHVPTASNTRIPKRQVSQKEYHLWSGCIFRSIAFYKFIEHGQNVMNMENSKNYVFCLKEKSCVFMEAVDYFFHLVPRIHQSSDIYLAIKEILDKNHNQKFLKSTMSTQNLISNSHLIFLLAEEYGFPLIKHLCRILEMPWMFLQQLQQIDSDRTDIFEQFYLFKTNINEGKKLSCVEDILISKGSNNIMYKNSTLSLNGMWKTETKFGKKQNRIDFFDSVHVNLKHDKNRCIFCTGCNNSKDWNQDASSLESFLSWNLQVGDHFIRQKQGSGITDLRESVNNNNIKSNLLHKIQGFNIERPLDKSGDDNQHTEKIYWVSIGSVIGDQYDIYVGSRLLPKTVGHDTFIQIQSLLYIEKKYSTRLTENQAALALRNLNNNNNKFEVQITNGTANGQLEISMAFYSLQIGFVQVPPIHISLSQLRMGDVMDGYICNQPWVISTVDIQSQSDNDENSCIMKKVYKYYKDIDAEDDNVPESPKQENDHNSSMVYTYDNDTFNHEYGICSPRPRSRSSSSSSSSTEDDDEDHCNTSRSSIDEVNHLNKYKGDDNENVLFVYTSCTKPKS